jgi:hypothetical protein
MDRLVSSSVVFGCILTAAACAGDSTTAAESETGPSETGPTEGTEPPPGDLPGSDTEGTETGTEPEPDPHEEIRLTVLLDGEPVEGATVMQGGVPIQHTTDADGSVLVPIDAEVGGMLTLIASDTNARTIGGIIPTPDQDPEMTIELTTLAEGDNEDYIFDDPGVPDNRGTTAQCRHCHGALLNDWWDSAHRTAASDVTVQDLYAGVAAAFDEAACTAAGGNWWEGTEPGTGEAMNRCYLGHGTLPDLNENCGDSEPCDGVATEFGACADCHAPGINGVMGGRDLLDARETEYEDGVHCDVCHKVESIDHGAPAGVAGRLVIKRPVEPSPSPGLGVFLPVIFGPYYDVPNPRMGSVQRDHFLNADLCSGCHQLDQEVLVPGAVLDADRWPDGVLPIHSTYDEWLAGPFNPTQPCSSCHMPPDFEEINSADYNEDTSFPGIPSGWPRQPGTVREHSFLGPRQPESGLSETAANLTIEKVVVADVLTATVTVRNTGCGHAIPTGDPLRSMVLYVEARCDGTALVATGGDAIPDFGGYLDRKESPEDWSLWPGAEVGDVIRVVSISAEWHDYTGFGPFGEGGFTPEEKGMPVEAIVGSSIVTAVAGDQVTLDQPLPAGDVAYRGDPDVFAVEADGSARNVAGAPGFAFARVLVDPDGTRMAPHFRAVDVASDNRILPQDTWSSTHEFESPCAEPTVRAVFVHRPYPSREARERGWSYTEALVAENED